MGELYIKVRVNRLVEEYLRNKIDKEELSSELKKLLELARESDSEEYASLIMKLLKNIEEGNLKKYSENP